MNIRSVLIFARNFEKATCEILRKKKRKREAMQAMHYCSQQTDKPRVSLCQTEVNVQTFSLQLNREFHKNCQPHIYKT